MPRGRRVWGRDAAQKTKRGIREKRVMPESPVSPVAKVGVGYDVGAAGNRRTGDRPDGGPEKQKARKNAG